MNNEGWNEDGWNGMEMNGQWNGMDQTNGRWMKWMEWSIISNGIHYDIPFDSIIMLHEKIKYVN